MEEQKFQMDFAGRPLVIEVGKLAKQASGAALVRYGDTAVFVTATGSKEAREDCRLRRKDVLRRQDSRRLHQTRRQTA